MSRSSGHVVSTFDFVSIQLYESYSHAVYNVSELSTLPAVYLESYVKKVLAGWKVDYRLFPPPPNDSLSSLSGGKGRIKIPASRLIIGTTVLYYCRILAVSLVFCAIN